MNQDLKMVVSSSNSFCFDIHRISADKQISASKAKGDKNINSSLFKLFVYHESEDEKLTLYSDFVSFRHQILGNGGIDVDSDSLPLGFFTYNDFSTRLKDIENLERRKRLNLFLNYKIIEGLEIYNDFYFKTQKVEYMDENYVENGAFYITTKEQFINSKLRYGGRIGTIEMPLSRSFQIDTFDDLKLIESLIKNG